MTTKAEASSGLGAKPTNLRWGWSAEAADRVVLTPWWDRFAWKATPVSCDGGHDAGDAAAQGNGERRQHLLRARDECEGRIRVVMARGAIGDDGRRRTEECFPRPDLLMRLTDLNGQTGEFRAELVGSGPSLRPGRARATSPTIRSLP